MKRKHLFLIVAAVITVLCVVANLPRDPEGDSVGEREIGRPFAFARWDDDAFRGFYLMPLVVDVAVLVVLLMVAWFCTRPRSSTPS